RAQVRDALLHVGRVDELAVAEDAARRLRALSLAIDFDVRETLEVAIEVHLRRARPAAALGAVLLTRRVRNLARILAVDVALGSALRDAVFAGMFLRAE